MAHQYPPAMPAAIRTSRTTITYTSHSVGLSTQTTPLLSAACPSGHARQLVPSGLIESALHRSQPTAADAVFGWWPGGHGWLSGGHEPSPPGAPQSCVTIAQPRSPGQQIWRGKEPEPTVVRMSPTNTLSAR